MKIWIGATLMLLLSASAIGDVLYPDSSTLVGTVTTANSIPLAKARVYAVHTETSFGGYAETNEQGVFEITDLPFGGYALRVERFGFKTRNLDVELGENEVDVEVALERGAGFTPEAGAPTPNNYATVKVFFGTDREEIQPGQFGPRRGELTFGFTEISIPRNHRMGRLESPSFWRLEFRPNPDKHVAVLDVSQRSRRDFVEDLTDAISNSESQAALVFVHGYNVTFTDASRRTAQIAYDLGFDGAPIMYSWPSNGRVVDYVGDGDNNAWSIPHLSDFIQLVAEQSGAQVVNIIAHSMGNRLLTSALAELGTTVDDTTLKRINQVALVAPDIDADIFRRDIAPRILPVGDRVTLYASSNDKALKAAKILRRGYPRAGDLSDGVVVLRGLDTIDVSAVDTSFDGHSYYAKNESVISDLFYLMRNIPPSDRYRLVQTSSDALPYWQFVP